MASVHNEPEMVSGKDLLDLLHAHLLAQEGRFIEAEQVLVNNGFPPGLVESLDLLARIEVQRGDDEQARNLWMMALKKQPGYAPAEEALEVLATPWRFKEQVRMVGRVVIGCAVCGLALFGIWRLGIERFPRKIDAVVEPIASGVVVESLGVTLMTHLEQLSAASVDFKVIPPFPIFADGATWGEGGEDWMAKLVPLLAAASSDYFIRVVVRATSEERATMPDVLERRIDFLQSVLAANQITIRTWWATGLSRNVEEGRTPYFVLVRKK